MYSLGFRVVAAKKTASKATEKNQSGNALWMTNGVRNANCSALRDTKKCKWLLNAGSGHHAFQIPHPRFKRQIPDVPICHAATSFVVSNETKVIAEKPHPVAPHRAFPFVFEMREPICSFDQHGTRTCLRPCQLHAVWGVQITDSLAI